MHVTNIFLLFTAALGTVTATPVDNSTDPMPFVCGNPPPTEEYLAQIREVAAMEETAGNLTEQATINANVYFHVVAASKTKKGGWVSVRTFLFPTSSSPFLPALPTPNHVFLLTENTK